MSRTRFGSIERAKRTLLDLPLALYHAARDHLGGVTAIAAIDGSNPTTLNHKLSPTNTTHTPNIHDLQLILAATRDPRIVDAILRPVGWVGIDVSDLRECDTQRSLLASIGELLAREGTVTQHLARSLDDGELDENELAELELLTERLAQAVFKLAECARRKHAEDVCHG